MSSRPPSRPRPTADPEQRPPLEWLTGVVRAVDTSGTPHTVDVDIDGGAVTAEGLTYPGWWSAEVGAVVELLRQGPRLRVFDVNAPARVQVGAHNHTTPPTDPTPPPAPGAAPTAPVTVRPVTVEAVDSGTYQPAYGSWREDQVGQGGDARRGLWFYGAAIAAAKGSGTITAGSILIRRKSNGGVDGAANVRLGTHSHASQPGGNPGALSNVALIGTLLPGKGSTFPLTAQHIADLNAGATGVGLEAGSTGYVSADYLLAEPRSAGEWSGVLQLTIEG